MNTVYVEVTDQPICADKVFKDLADSSCGAQLVFLGTVRDFNLGKPVKAVAYDAFTPLVEKTFNEICKEASLKFGELPKVTLIHRVGKLEIGEISVAIAIASPHRGEAYEASRYIIEELKTRAPIWKKEFYEDGESEWLRGHGLCSHHKTGRDDFGGREVHPHGAG